MIRCNGCGQDLSEDAYYRRTSGKFYSPCIECVKQQRRGYYKANKEKIGARADRYRKANWAKTLHRAKLWKRKNKAKLSVENRAYRERLKLAALRHYGGAAPKCACCGIDDLVFLTLDHIDNDGAGDRILLGTSGAGHNYYRWLAKNGFPRKLRVLCWNCNAARWLKGACPHEANHVAAI